jgi:hypothetical protein
MTYQTRSDVPLKPLRQIQAQAVVELDDTGDLVAIHYEAVRTAGNTLSCQASAWLIDADGDPQATVDAAGVPVFSEFRHNASAAQLARLGCEALAGALTRLVLGEPADDVIPWPQDIRDSVSIRNAIAVARASGPLADIGAVL